MAAEENGERREGLPAQIGPYRILKLLGEGSNGRVYLAAESVPAREVALKVLRGAALSAEAHQRFRREAELLAQLEHPNIARLYAAGVIDGDGGALPYLAMEYVRGGDLLSHAQQQHLDLRAKLDLLAAVCRAVHYAHSRGIVHRDLKPANILVDDQGQPRILDFGIAAFVRDAAAITVAGQVLGTVPYMSAEQLAGGAQRSDPRSDVYSLGVIAYQLLCGQLPYPGLSQSTVIEAIALIRSGRIAPLSRMLPAARGDVETVVMKAMSAEAAQRYGSAAELAADMERVLDRRPIEARPPTLTYWLGLLLRRHRLAALALLIALLALIGGGVMSLRFALSEQAAHAQAEARAAQLDASNRFLENVLSASDAEVSQQRPPSLREFLDEARRSLAADRSIPPPVRAIVARTMSLTYAHGGDVARGLELIAQAQAALAASADVDDETRDRLHAAHAEILLAAGRNDEALSQLRPLLAQPQPATRRAQQIWIDAREQAVIAMAALGRVAEAQALATPLRADAERLLGANDPLSLAAAAQQANLRHQAGDAADAKAEYEALIPRFAGQLGPYHTYTLQARLALAAIERELGDLPASAALTRALVTDLERELGPRHMLTITSHFMLAAVLHSQQPGSAEAVQQLRGVLAQYREQLGPDHAYTISAMSALSVFLQAQNQFVEAAELSRAALDAIEKQGNADGPEVLPAYNGYALLLMRMGRLDEARARFETLLQRARATLGDAHLQTITYAANYGDCLLRSKRYAAALAILQPDYRQALQTLGAAHPQTRKTAALLASAYRGLGREAEAAPLDALAAAH